MRWSIQFTVFTVSQHQHGNLIAGGGFAGMSSSVVFLGGVKIKPHFRMGRAVHRQSQVGMSRGSSVFSYQPSQLLLLWPEECKCVYVSRKTPDHKNTQPFVWIPPSLPSLTRMDLWVPEPFLMCFLQLNDHNIRHPHQRRKLSCFFCGQLFVASFIIFSWAALRIIYHISTVSWSTYTKALVVCMHHKSCLAL